MIDPLSLLAVRAAALRTKMASGDLAVPFSPAANLVLPFDTAGGDPLTFTSSKILRPAASAVPAKPKPADPEVPAAPLTLRRRLTEKMTNLFRGATASTLDRFDHRFGR